MRELESSTLRTLAGAQIFGGAAFFIGVAVIALVARDVSGTKALAGVPLSIGVAAGALCAFPLGRWMARVGRRPALVTALIAGAAGAGVILAGAEAGSFALVCAGGALFGIGNASNLLARYAAADLPPPERRGKAISYVLFSTAAGAVLAPNLAPAFESLAEDVGLTGSSGPFAFAALAFLAAAAIIWVRLRPDPLIVAREAEAATREAEAVLRADLSGSAPAESPHPDLEVPHAIWHGRALLAAIALVASNLVMVSVMAMAPIHMQDAGQSLGTIGLVLSIHFAGMFLPAPIAGWIADRYGRIATLCGAAAMLSAAAVVAALSPGDETPLMVLSLLMLGFGWCLGLVGGSTLLTDSVGPARRAEAQGAADLAMGLAGATAGLGAGPLLAAGGFSLLGVAGAVIGSALLIRSLVELRRPAIA